MRDLFERVDQRRTAMGLSKSALCRKAGIYESTYLDFKRGAIPRLQTLLKISRALRVNIQWLLDGTGPIDFQEGSK